MKLPIPAVPAALAAALLTAGCGASPGDPWLSDVAYAVGAQAGGSSLLRSHSAVGPTCAVGPAPEVEILAQGKLGVARVAPAVDAIDAPGAECDGDAAAGTGVFFDAAAGAAGVDTVVYRELRRGPLPDRTYTANILVR